jgi:hypothetical protein
MSWALGAVALLLGLYLSAFFFPYPLFPHHMEASGFKVYSDHEIPENFKLVLDDARRRVEAMPLYRADAMPRIFVCRSMRLFEFLVKLAGRDHAGQGLLVSMAGNAFFSEHGIEAVARRNQTRPAHSRLEGSWSAAIAHEVAHHLVFTEMGFFGAWRIPVWKSEGYADCTANLTEGGSDPVRETLYQVALLVDDSLWQGPTGAIDRRHFRWQVMVKFLCEVKGLGLTGLLAEDVTEAGTWTQLINWQRRSSHPMEVDWRNFTSMIAPSSECESACLTRCCSGPGQREVSVAQAFY